MGESTLPRPSPIVCDGSPLPEGGGYSWDDGFCDFTFGSAQNDSIGGDVGELNENKVKVLSCSYGSDTNHLAVPLSHKRGLGNVIAHFLSSFAQSYWSC